MENWQQAGFGIYVHWPFCAAKCPYCDFNSHVATAIDSARWQDAYLADLDRWADRLPDRVVASVFFGGGTPSLMDPAVTAAILDRIRTRWTVANDLEVTLEANPTSVEAARFADFVGAGVTRFSVGLQSLRDPDLKALGRLHSAAEGRHAYDIARAACDRVSFDLIYARQGQDAAAWRTELGEALALEPTHLSLYQLTVEPGTAFGDRAAAGRLRGLPDEDLAVDLWQITQEMTASAGLPRYETSNHSASGAESRHNLIYWRGGDWLGIGPGAHGRVGIGPDRLATTAPPLPRDWLSRTGIDPEEALPRPEIVDEYVLSALRLTEGIDLDRLHRLGGSFDATTVANLAADNFVIQQDGRLRTTETGALLLNRVVGALLSGTLPGQ